MKTFYYIFKECPIIHNNLYFYKERYLPSRKTGRTLKSAFRKKTVYYHCRNNC